MNYRVSTNRGANQVAANPQKMGTPKDDRWATGRNAKRSLPGGRYDIVESWTLKERAADGSVRTVRRGVTRRLAEEWVSGGEEA